jgi:hypothetical protein
MKYATRHTLHYANQSKIFWYALCLLYIHNCCYSQTIDGGSVQYNANLLKINMSTVIQFSASVSNDKRARKKLTDFKMTSAAGSRAADVSECTLGRERKRN